MDVRLYRVITHDSNEHVTVYQTRYFKSALSTLKRVRRAAKQSGNADTRYTLEYLDNGLVKGELACYE